MRLDVKAHFYQPDRLSTYKLKRVSVLTGAPSQLIRFLLAVFSILIRDILKKQRVVVTDLELAMHNKDYLFNMLATFLDNF